MPAKSTRPLKVYIRFLRMKLGVLLTFALGPKIEKREQQYNEINPLDIFSKRRIIG